MAVKSEVIVGLDIGTTKIAVIVAQPDTKGGLDIIGIGTNPSNGLRKGEVINIDATVESIRTAVKEAELMAGCQITNVFAGIAGAHIRGINSHGIVAIKSKEVTPRDVERVIDAARAIPIPPDREILHILPQEYIVDDQDGIKEPVGMAGVRLEAKVHVITGAVTSAQNIARSAQRVGLNVCDIVLEPIASAEAVLSPEEKELGVAIVDIGGGTTDITVFQEGAVKHSAVLGLGGNHITKDIATGLRAPISAAESLKRRYGSALMKNIQATETIEVPQTGGREPRILSRHVLAEIIEPRMEEILHLVYADLRASGFDEVLTSGIVLTGGTVLLDGTVEMAEHIFGLPIRLGYPTGVGGLVDVVNSPAFSTGVGLALYGLHQQDYRWAMPKSGDSLFSRVKARMLEWLAEHF